MDWGGTHSPSSDKNYNLAEMTKKRFVSRCLFCCCCCFCYRWIVCCCCCWCRYLFFCFCVRFFLNFSCSCGSGKWIKSAWKCWDSRMVCIYVLETANIDFVSILRASAQPFPSSCSLFYLFIVVGVFRFSQIAYNVYFVVIIIVVVAVVVVLYYICCCRRSYYMDGSVQLLQHEYIYLRTINIQIAVSKIQ